jgi:hypothetical protein
VGGGKRSLRRTKLSNKGSSAPERRSYRVPVADLIYKELVFVLAAGSFNAIILSFSAPSGIKEYGNDFSVAQDITVC